MDQLWEILVPTMRKDKPIKARYHRVWDKKVREISGGLTILTPAKGQWVAPDGELFVERMIPVRIMCREDEIEAIADMTAKYYDQKAVMYYRVSDHVKIKHYDKPQEQPSPTSSQVLPPSRRVKRARIHKGVDSR